jgi:DNA-binding transcriptional LysR family regulator
MVVQDCTTMFDWNDLRYFVAVARHGSALAAAKALQVDPSTVQRRLQALEQRLGRPLLERLPSGSQLTSFGRSLLPQAQAVERAVQAMEQQVAALGRDVTGVVRVTCPEPIVLRLTGSLLLERFHALHPGLRVEFVISDRYVDLSKGEADVALRSGDTDDGDLVGRKIADSLWAVYASATYVQRHGRPGSVDDLDAHAWVAFDESMANHRASAWLRRVAPDARIAASANSVLGAVYSAKAGLGLAALPTAIGDAEPDLVRVLGPVDELTRIWRILAHPDARATPRVAAFFDFIVSQQQSLQPILTGAPK